MTLSGRGTICAAAPNGGGGFRSSRETAMATHITQDCINCGACEPECPNQAISEGDEIDVINPELCTECVGFYDHEACQAVCPVECCLPNPEIVESEEILIARLGPRWRPTSPKPRGRKVAAKR